MIPRQLVVTTAALFVLAAGMGLYVLRLQRQQNAVPVQLRETVHVSPPMPTAPAQNVSVWVAHDDTGTLRAQSIAVPAASDRQQNAEDILRALLKIYIASDSPHRMGAASDIRDVYVAKTGLAVIDVNSAFADEQTSGVLAEELTVVSFVQTLSSNVPGLLRVKFLVDGKERDTLAGHADLTAFYDVSQVAQLAKQLAAE